MFFKLSIALATLALMACGGSSGSSASNPAGPGGPGYRMSEPMGMGGDAHPSGRPVEPVEIAVKGTRVGNSVRLDVMGHGERRPAGHAMEKAENWTVKAMAGDTVLERVVNGSVKVERAQVGSPSLGLWDIKVRFSVAFTIPEDAEEISVEITAPESMVYEEIMTIGLDPAKVKAKAKAKARPRSKGKGKGKKRGQSK